MKTCACLFLALCQPIFFPNIAFIPGLPTSGAAGVAATCFDVPVPAAAIDWVEPAWQADPILHEDYHLPVKVMIQSSAPLEVRDVYFIKQDVAIIRPLDARLKLVDGYTYEFLATLYLQNNGVTKFQLVVKNDLVSLTSQPLTINFVPFEPNLHVLSIGPQTTLDYAISDALDFSRLFPGQGRTGGGIFNKVQVETLTGRQATARQIQQAVEELKSKAVAGEIGKRDILILFISSHGFIAPDGRLRLQGDDYDPADPMQTSIAYEDIVNALKEIYCKKVIFIDACYSAGSKNEDLDTQYDILQREVDGISTIVSSRGDEASYEDLRWRNGAFTEAIIEGLQGAQADRDGNKLVTVDELWEYIKVRVPNLVAAVKKGVQHPRLLSNEMGQLPIYSVYR